MKRYLDWKRICFLVHMAHVVAVFASFANAAEIVGPPKLEPGRIGVYTVKHEGPADAGIKWDVEQVGAFWEYDSAVTANVLHVTSKAGGKFKLEADIVDWDARKFETVSLDITIGEEPKPPPGPDPGPGPGPDPPPPQPDSELSKRVAEWAKDRSKDQRNLLAESFRQAANDAKGSVDDCEDLAREYNRKFLGESRLDWLPFFRNLQDYLQGLRDAGKWTTVEQCKAVYREIANGLEVK